MSDRQFGPRRTDIPLRVGYRLGVLGGADPTVELSVGAERRERPRVGGHEIGGADQRVVGQSTEPRLNFKRTRDIPPRVD